MVLCELQTKTFFNNKNWYFYLIKTVVRLDKLFVQIILKILLQLTDIEFSVKLFFF